MDIVERAIKAVGGARALAGKLGLSTQAVNKWRAKKQVPLKRWWDVSRITGIPREAFMPKPERHLRAVKRNGR